MGARTVCLVAVLGLLCLVPASPARADAAACGEDLTGVLGQVSTRTLAPGVELTVWTGSRAATDPAPAAVRAAVVRSSGGFAGLKPILVLPRRQDPAAMLDGVGALAAVNGDLFSSVALDAAVPTGPVVVDRTVLYAPPARRPVLHWSADRPRVHRSLLRDGLMTRDCAIPGSLLRPRTALAWNDEGDSWLAVITNGLDDPPSGMRVGGAAVTAFGRWLASLGATDAVLLDGGGSTIMLRDTPAGPRRVDLPASTYRRPVPVLLSVVG